VLPTSKAARRGLLLESGTMEYQEYGSESDLPLFSAANHSCAIEQPRHVDTGLLKKHCGEILEELMRGPLSCFDVESRWHRGQAAVHNLRQEGHVIDTIRGKYLYRGFSGEMKTVTKSVRDMYYETAHWRATAKARKEIDLFRCIQCRASKDLETHHWVYNLFQEEMSELSTFCKTCHDFIHEVIKCSSVHFPRKLTQETINRIMQG
jgi:hypothetical protein